MDCSRVELLLLFFAAVTMMVHVQGGRVRNKTPRLKELKNGNFVCRPRRCPNGQKTNPPFCECIAEECQLRACPHGERFDERKCDCVPGCFLETCPSNQILNPDLCACVTDVENAVDTGIERECQAPPTGCPMASRWDADLCRCVEIIQKAPIISKAPKVKYHVVCEMPGDECEPGYVWNAVQCQCRWVRSNFDNHLCADPPLPCLNNQKWDKDLCECRPVAAADICRPPNKGCRNGRQWDLNRCKCVRPESIIAEEIMEPQPCVVPEAGCRARQYFDREFCQCRNTSYY